MGELLRFSAGRVRDPAIPAWFDAHPADLAAVGREWFARIRRSGPDVRELMHDGCPVVCVDAAPFAYVNIFTSHVNVGFFHGAALPDPAGLLEGTGKHMRHVKLKAPFTADAAALDALIAAAYIDIIGRLKFE